LRCNACGQVFTAEEPEGVGADKYDATAIAMIAQLKYGTGVPGSDVALFGAVRTPFIFWRLRK
jgi:hypothetical protein